MYHCKLIKECIKGKLVIKPIANIAFPISFLELLTKELSMNSFLYNLVSDFDYEYLQGWKEIDVRKEKIYIQRIEKSIQVFDDFSLEQLENSYRNENVSKKMDFEEYVELHRLVICETILAFKDELGIDDIECGKKLLKTLDAESIFRAEFLPDGEQILEIIRSVCEIEMLIDACISKYNLLVDEFRKF